MAVRAQLRCSSIEENTGGSTTVTLSAAGVATRHNVDWTKGTPEGELKLKVSTDEAKAFFREGGTYNISIEDVG